MVVDAADLEAARAWVHAAQNIFVLTGAGI
jgi:NAD-dependent SIR2 family protein deacetylase